MDARATTRELGGPASKRALLVSTAAHLAHKQGFNQTTLADIARHSGVPLGNVYYYFKTKEALGEALVDRLVVMSESMRQRWDVEPNPKRRLEAFIQMSISNGESLARSGCPIGTLCGELHKEGGPLADRAATLLAQLLNWIEAQFQLIGKRRQSRELAIHLLSAIQGASLLTHIFHSPHYIDQEAGRLEAWVRSI